ncbi:tRNA (adenosine(37)-N6)-dimethylallyltransferase MiaA [Flavobacterium aurantiibacter]|uniref:tRNA dimethylallyltransferase n=1 Tax=Flavobacterium aurantiibacter TaxID=2023067 RepID=A0A255ZPU5_9FLAO|nr:tRNA (adenosine(37)-N6)-dimethylallyltransferase MiaA [Flavobacterium aurantiibacter]OYQ43422.1 tRNA (adenosine(37)-N6)-dimethylallyltransferase MiaA [Flavobacterium aurantiibacter]
MKPNVYFVVGPTAIGKTAFAISLAKQLHTEIISADSRQFYRDMYIGTAVPSIDELAAVPHHFIQHKSIFDNYSVGDFEKEALVKIDELLKAFGSAVVVGGSGLYIEALIKGLDVFPDVPDAVRTEVRDLYQNEGLSAIQNRLQQLDSEYYNEVDLQNPQRILRALEVSLASEKPYSFWRNQNQVYRNFETKLLGLRTDRSLIYERINKRVDIMMADGLLEEAKDLYENRNLNALNTVGYKELFQCFDGEISLENAVEAIKMNTRRFAKRQLTYFQNRLSATWLDIQQLPNIEVLLKEL